MAAVLAAHATGRRLSLSTSGTTRPARAVLRTTASWWDSFEALSALTGTTSRSRIWVPGPVTATMNLFALVHASATGARAVGNPDAATHAHLTPALLARSLDDLPAGATVVVAGDALPPSLASRARRAGLRLHHYYGTAELSFVAWDSGDGLRAFPGVRMDIRDGEIWACSPYLCDGYLGSPGPLRRDGAWATVGDLGELHEDVLVVSGRGDDVVTTAGATVQVGEVERVLGEVARVVVLGVPHPDLGQVLVAVLDDREHLALLRATSRADLRPSHRPRRWYAAPFPLTPAGKVDRDALRALVASGQLTVLA